MGLRRCQRKKFYNVAGWLDESGRPTSPPKLHYDDLNHGNALRRVSRGAATFGMKTLGKKTLVAYAVLF
jgi:hypothetical protein